MSFSSADTTNQHLYTFLQSVRSETQWHFSYRPQLVAVYIEKFCFQYCVRLFNDTLLYCKPAYHHSCWLTQRCQMYQAQKKPSDWFAVTKEQQLASKSVSQRWRPVRPSCVSRLGAKVASGIIEGLWDRRRWYGILL